LLLKEPHVGDWVIVIFIVLTGLLAVAAYFYADRFRAFCKSPFSMAYPEQHLIRTQRGRDAFSFLMELFFYPATALLLFVAIRLVSGRPLLLDDWIYFLEATIGLAIFFVVQSWLMNLYAVIFDASKSFDLYAFQKMTFRQWSLIWAFPLAFVAVFFKWQQEVWAWLALGTFAFGFLYGWVFSIGRLISELGGIKLHFLLYLCALEIGLFLIAAKLVIQW
jgi:hypothetical protein